ncbi:hypothetical protein [Ruegeria sp. HKCCD6157]|uniref:hypothetical protein n=1 Tax=Ruegeria sp. HKCCD6157 TaxID=2690707 RepID=UPI001490C3F0|nr:hypothetical protein [Ruegeria sp. HKCCD6157]NOE26455.1 hypothetical protein [Ruegeria sp. HKCCD6157]
MSADENDNRKEHDYTESEKTDPECRSVDDRLTAIEQRLDQLMRVMEPGPEDRLETVEHRVDALLTSIESLGEQGYHSSDFNPTSTGPAFGFVDAGSVGAPTRRTFSWAKNCCKNWCSIRASSKGCHPNAC